MLDVSGLDVLWHMGRGSLNYTAATLAPSASKMNEPTCQATIPLRQFKNRDTALFVIWDHFTHLAYYFTSIKLL